MTVVSFLFPRQVSLFLFFWTYIILPGLKGYIISSSDQFSPDLRSGGSLWDLDLHSQLIPSDYLHYPIRNFDLCLLTTQNLNVILTDRGSSFRDRV